MAKILLVEDEADNAEIVLRLLRPKNHDVVHVWDGPTAVRHCSAERPELILMDMKLIDFGAGQQATREIRALPGMHEVPIIALTGQVMAADVEDMYRAGCNDVIYKPLDLKKLLTKIQALLST